MAGCLCFSAPVKAFQVGGASTGRLHDRLTVQSGTLNDISNTVREIGQRLNPKKRARQYIRHIRSTERTDERSGTPPAPWPGSYEIHPVRFREDDGRQPAFAERYMARPQVIVYRGTELRPRST